MSVDPGRLSVVVAGTTKMLLWCAVNWGFLLQVSTIVTLILWLNQLSGRNSIIAIFLDPTMWKVATLNFLGDPT